MGAGEGRPHVPDEIRGRGSIQGRVRQSGEPAEASVELRHVAEFDPKNPFLGGGVGMMIERMLDAGISTKEVIARTQTDGDGTYRFGRLAPGLYEVRAMAPSGALGLASAVLPAHGARVEANIDLPAGDGRLVGRVVFADGTPFRGLVVAMGDQGFAALLGGGHGMQPAWTDPEGRFVLAGLSPGTTRVSAMVPGVMRVVTAAITIPYEGEYLLTIDADGVEASGQVVSAAAGEAVAGASVFGGGGDGENTFAIRSTTSDAGGRFRLLVPAGRGGLLVRAKGYAAQNVDLRGGSRKDLVVTLQALGSVRGRVVTKADGTPARGVLVIAAPQDRGGMSVPSGTATDEAGAYVLADVPPGTVRLQALGAGWISLGAGDAGRDASYNPYVVEVEPGGTREIDLEVIPAARATGRVTDADGAPVAGCVVQAGKGGDGLGTFLSMFMGLGGSIGSAVTDADGLYLLDTLVPDRPFTLTARAPEHPDATSEPFRAVGGETHRVDLVFEASRWLDLRVVGAEGGGPVAGATIQLGPKEGGGVMRLGLFDGGSTSRTDADGRVRLGPLPPGDLELAVEADGYVRRAEIPVEGDGSTDVTQTVELKRGLVIAGGVVLPEGVPVAGVRVNVRLERSPADVRAWFHGRPPVAPDGTFRLATLEHPGAYKVTADAEWEETRYRAEALVQAGDEEVRLELTAVEGSGGRLKVRVLGADGKPVASARIQLYQYHGHDSSGSSSRRLSNGEAEFASVNPEAELWIEVWDAVGSQHGAVIAGPFTAGPKELEVRLPRGLTIAGTVVGPDGKGVRGVQVKAHAPHPAARDRWAEDHDTAFTDEEGRFLLEELGDFGYRLSFKGPPEYAPTPDQTVRAGEKNLRVTLRAGLAAALTVLDYEGRPVADVDVWLRPPRQERDVQGGESWRPHRQHASSDASGLVRLQGLEPGRAYDVDLSPPDARKDLNGERLEGWSPADETIRLTRAYGIAGTVSDLDGKPVANAWVRYRKAGETSWQGSQQTEEDGRFEVPKLTQGRYELRVEVPGQTQMYGPGAATADADLRVARAGEQNVHLVVDMGATLLVKVEGLENPVPGGPSGVPYEVRSPMATLRSQSQPFVTTQQHVGADGRARFRGLRSDVAYTFWITGLPGGRYALVRDLRAGGAEVVVRAQPGGSLRGRVVLPAGVEFRHLGVTATHTLQMSASAAGDPKTGTFELDGLPEGTWTVRCWALAGEKMYVGSAQGSLGTEVVITLQRQERRVR